MSKVTFKMSRPILFTISVVIIIAALVGIIEFSRFYDKYTWVKRTQQLAHAKLKGEVNKIQKIFFSIEQIPHNLAFVLEFSKPDLKEIEILLNAVVQNNDEVFGTCIAFEPNAFYKDSIYYAPYLYKKDGMLINVNPSDTAYYYFSTDWYLIPRSLEKPVWIEPYFDEGISGGNFVMATYSVPFYSYDGMKETLRGVVAVDISIDWLAKIVSSIKLFNESYCIMVSENGTIISAPNSQWTFNESLFSLAEENDLPVFRNIGRDLRKGKSGFVNAGKIGTNRNWWVSYMTIPNNNWGILLMLPEGYDIED